MLNRLCLSICAVLLVIIIVFITIQSSDISMPPPEQETSSTAAIDSAAGDERASGDENCADSPTDETVAEHFLPNEIIIQIVDEYRKPIPSAEIQLLNAAPPVTISSDQSGKTVIDDAGSSLETLTLKVIAAEHFPFYGTFSIPDEGVVTVVLYKKLFIAGCVIDENNEAVHDILIQCANWDAAAESRTYSQAAPSAMDGTFTHGPLYSGSYRLTAYDPEYMSDLTQAKAGEENVVIVVSKNAALTVNMLSRRKEPVYGAEVELRSLKEGSHYLASGISNLSGAITFTNLVRGDYAISIAHDWYVDIDSQTITVEQRTQEETILLEDNLYRISGHVFDANTQKGIGGAPVVCTKMNPGIYHDISSSSQTVHTGPTGSYCFSDLYGGEYRLYVDEMPGYISGMKREYSTLGISLPIQIPLGEKKEVDNVNFYLKKGWTIEGRVIDDSGDLISEAIVKSTVVYDSRAAKSPGDHKEYKSAVTNKKGFYQIFGDVDFNNNRTFLFLVPHKKGYIFHEIPERLQIKSNQTIQNHDLRLIKASVVEGSVLDADGKPIENATVNFVPSFLKKSDMNAATDKNGNYSITLHSEKYSVSSYKKGYRYVDEANKIKEIDLEDAYKNETVNFILKKDEWMICGKVIDDQNEPVEGVWIHIIARMRYGRFGEESYRKNRAAQTDEMGMFCIDLNDIPPSFEIDSIDLWTEANESYSRSTVEDIPPDISDVILIQVESGEQYGSIEGCVVDSHSNVVNEYEILIVPSGFIYRDHPNYVWNRVGSPEGKFIVKNLPIEGSPFVICARSSDGSVGFLEYVEVRGGEYRKGIIVPIESGITVRGNVVLNDPADSYGDASVLYLPQTLPGPQKIGDLNRISMMAGSPFLEHFEQAVRLNPDGSFVIRALRNHEFILLFKCKEKTNRLEVKTGLSADIHIGTVIIE